MFLIFFHTIFGGDEATVSQQVTVQRPNYDLNTYQTTGELSLFKGDVFGDAWKYHLLEGPEDLTVYQNIMSKIFNSQIDKNDRIVTLASTFFKQWMPRIFESFLEFSGSNVSMSRIIILFEDKSGAKQTKSVLLFENPCVSGKRNKEGKDMDSKKLYFFADDIPRDLMKQSFLEFGITLLLAKQMETDQVLILQLFNLNADSFNSSKTNGIPLDAKIKGVVIDTVTYYDPCTWCSPLFKIQDIRDRIATKIKSALTKVGLTCDQNSFKLAFLFTAVKGCGFRPEGTFSRAHPPQPMPLSIYEVFDYNN